MRTIFFFFFEQNMGIFRRFFDWETSNACLRKFFFFYFDVYDYISKNKHRTLAALRSIQKSCDGKMTFSFVCKLRDLVHLSDVLDKQLLDIDYLY